jgi:threonylcarbamoyladenosine tRNA methylthiotransferase MtaB
VAEVLKEIRAINKPIILTGIDLSSYAHLSELCAQINKPFEMSSMEVGIITSEFLQVLKSNNNFVPHFHLSLQSGSDSVLRAMNRKYTTQQYFEKVQMIRNTFPNARLTTDIICGFPTETDQNHQETMEFVKRVGFDDAHVFPYSRRKGTKAYDLAQVRDSVITERAKQLGDIFHTMK